MDNQATPGDKIVIQSGHADYTGQELTVSKCPCVPGRCILKSHQKMTWFFSERLRMLTWTVPAYSSIVSCKSENCTKNVDQLLKDQLNDNMNKIFG